MPELESLQSASSETLDSDRESVRCELPMTLEQKEWLLAIVNCDQLKITNMLKKNKKLALWKTGLHYAAKFGDCALIRLLAGDNGANVNARNNGLTPLHMAAANAQNDAILLLTSVYSADTGLRDYNGRLPCACLPQTKEGQALLKYCKNPLNALLNDQSSLLYMLFRSREPGDEESASSSTEQPGVTPSGDSEGSIFGGLSSPLTPQFPWQSSGKSGADQSPVRSSRDRSLTRLPERIRSIGHRSRSREPRTEKVKKPTALEHVASFAQATLGHVRRRPTELSLPGTSSTKTSGKECKPALRRTATTGTELAEDIYRSVRRRREQMGPKYNPLTAEPSPMDSDSLNKPTSPSVRGSVRLRKARATTEMRRRDGQSDLSTDEETDPPTPTNQSQTDLHSLERHDTLVSRNK